MAFSRVCESPAQSIWLLIIGEERLLDNKKHYTNITHSIIGYQESVVNKVRDRIQVTYMQSTVFPRRPTSRGM
jgi:hypothetical protein